jgi:hypothetical protein
VGAGAWMAAAVRARSSSLTLRALFLLYCSMFYWIYVVVVTPVT